MKNLFVALSLVILAGLGSCISKSKVSSAAYGKYISGFTSGTVDPDEEIKIELAQELLDSARFDRKDTAFLEKCLNISPSVKGKIYWKNEKTIAFKPDTRFREGKSYHVALNLGKLSKVPSDFRMFDFFFETETQKLTVGDPVLSFYDDYNIEWERCAITVTSNVILDTNELKKCFTVKQGNKTFPVRCIALENDNYRILADSIVRGEKASKLDISWNGGKVGCDVKGSKSINISSLGSYTVLQMVVKDDGDQKLDITFSDPILPNQNFDGLIAVEDATKMQFSTSGNVVTVFFPERLTGEKKVTINKGLLNFRNYKMDAGTSGIVEFAGPKPALRMDGQGCILPNSQGLLFPFESIGIHTVDVRVIKIKEQNIHQFLQANELDGHDELTRVGKIAIEKTIRIIADTTTPQNQWTTHILDLGKLIQPEPGSLYRVCIRFKKVYTFLPCRNEKEEEDSEYIYDVEPEQDSTWNEYGWHGEGFDGYNTWRYDDDEPCSEDYYRGGAIARNILASDIGVIYQEEKNKTAKIVTTNLLNAQPLGNTEVVLYSYTREKIASGTTNEEGFLQVSLSEKPFLLVAKKDKQRAYLKLTNSNCLSTAKFNVEGSDQANGLMGFMYTERGVWRPGDSVFLNFVLNDMSSPLPEKHPIRFELSDPDGKLLFKRTVTENSGHIYPLYFQTSSNAPMGNYTAKVVVGNAVFTKDILLEYIVPNRMKLATGMENKMLTAADRTTDLKVKWLNGAVGKGLKAQASVTLRPDFSYFDKYEGYTFVAPYNENFRGSFELPECITNDSGMAYFNNTGLQVSNAPGMLHVTYVFKAYEQGGGFSIDKTSANLSFYDAYVGLEKPSGTSYYGSFDYSKTYAFNYVVTTKDQQKISGHHLQLKIYEMQQQRWYEANEDDIASFRTQTSKICVKDTQWIDSKGAGSFNFGNTGKRYGRYMMILKDLATSHETGCLVVFDDPGWNRYSNDDADYESIVQLSSSKKEYKVGDKIQINVPAAENANILINIESDAKVLRQFWVKGSASHKPIEFSTTTDMAPGIYIHATILQPHHYTKDGSPIRQYGILPLKVEDPETKLLPVVTIKDEVRPEVINTIGISEEKGKEMYYSLVLVDEGLLDLTHFYTPDIWEYMNAQQSLKIKTWDMFNQVIGAYAGKIQNVFTIGGDGSYDESENTKANRFKPAVINLGIFHLDAGQKQTHRFSVPNYCGSMKAFVIAYHNGKSGSTSKNFFVRKPLMLLTSAPRMMSAAEVYNIPVTVFNMEAKARTATVSINVTGLDGYKYNTSQVLHFKTAGDEIVNFELKMPGETGVANLDVSVSDGREQSKEHIEIQVKPTRPSINHQKVVEVEPGTAQTFDVNPKGMKGTYSGDLTISDIPNLNFSQKLNYLIEYPHGCVEQTTSSAFAQLFINDMQDLSDEEAARVKKHVESVIKRLNQYQTYTGGFTYWPYQYDVSDFPTVYVLHFMMEAKRKGFEVPKYVMDNAITYEKDQAGKYDNSSSTASNNYSEPELTQAYRLYLLAELGMADLTSMNKMRASTINDNLSKALLAKAYHIIGQGTTAAELCNGISISRPRTFNTTFSSSLRDKSLMLIALERMGNTIPCQKLANDIGAELNTGWNSTLATSLALVSLSEHYGMSAATVKRYSLNGQATTFLKHSTSMKLNKKTLTGKLVFKNESGRKMYITLNEYYADMTEHIPLVNNGMQLKVTYMTMNNAAINETTLPHGTNFMAKIQVTNTTNTTMQNVALDYFTANGWQLVSNRYIDDESINKNSAYDFKNVQDERVNFYFDLNAKETKTFYLQLNASYKGRFFLALAQCYPMYNESYKAQVAGKWVTVN